MNAPLDLDALEAAARGKPSDVATWCALADRATVLELITQLRKARKKNGELMHSLNVACQQARSEQRLSFRDEVEKLRKRVAELEAASK